MRNIFIIGATGKVGGAVVRELSLQDSIKVTVGARNVEKATNDLPKNVRVVYFDLDNKQSIDKALDGVDSVLLMTGYTVDMMRQSKRVIDSAKKAGVTQMVHIGASSSTDEAANEVAHWGWHQMIEAYIAGSGFESYTFLHPESFMQNLTAFYWLQSSAKLTNVIGDAVWSWIDTADIAALAAQTLLKPDDEQFKNAHWRLGYDAASMQDVADMLNEGLNVKPVDGTTKSTAITLEPLAADDFYAAAVAGGGDPTYLNCIRTQFDMCAKGVFGPGISEIFDAEAFEAAVGRRPITWAEHIRNNHAALKEAAYGSE